MWPQSGRERFSTGHWDSTEGGPGCEAGRNCERCVVCQQPTSPVGPDCPGSEHRLCHFSIPPPPPLSDFGEEDGARRQSNSAEALVSSCPLVTLDRSYGGPAVASDGLMLGCVHCWPVHLSVALLTGVTDAGTGLRRLLSSRALTMMNELLLLLVGEFLSCCGRHCPGAADAVAVCHPRRTGKVLMP